MRQLQSTLVGFALGLCLLIAAGCDRSASPPVPLAVEQLPSMLEKVFGKANPEVKELVNQIISSVKAQDYTKAFADFQSLAAVPGLTREQSSVVGRGTLTVNGLMQAAAAKGDENAAQAVKVYRSTK